MLLWLRHYVYEKVCVCVKYIRVCMYLWRDGSGHGCDGGVRGRLPREGGAQLQRVHGGELAQGLQAQAQLTQSKGKVTITCQKNR